MTTDTGQPVPTNEVPYPFINLVLSIIILTMIQSHVFIVGESSEERARRERKRQLRDLNARVWNGETGLSNQIRINLYVVGIFKLSSSLDSSLKKNTAFIKRLRTSLNSDNQSSLLKDISGLSLEKYIPEVVGAATEGLQKCKSVSDILAAVEVPPSTCKNILMAGYFCFTSTVWDSIYTPFDGQYSPCIGACESTTTRCSLRRSTRKRRICKISS